jgi:DNA-binding NarL/FixJ family response regulator
MRKRRVVHIVEPQDLFVPTLVDVFQEAGLGVDRVDDEIDPQTLLDEQPDVVFIDADYLADSLRSVRLAHVLAPGATIFVYGGAQGRRAREAFIAAGASLVLGKNAERGLIVEALRSIRAF